MCCPAEYLLQTFSPMVPGGSYTLVITIPKKTAHCFHPGVTCVPSSMRRSSPLVESLFTKYVRMRWLSVCQFARLSLKM